MLSHGKRIPAVFLALAILCALTACGGAGSGVQPTAQSSVQPTAQPTQTPPQEEPESYDFTVDLAGFKTGDVSSGIGVHDPSILEADGKYYIFGSHMTAAVCDDLRSWVSIADGYDPANPVYGQIYDVAETAFRWAGSKDSAIPTEDGGDHVWAPHVIYNSTMGLYCMYYCTSSNWYASNLCFGTSERPEGPYVWQDMLICSGFTMVDIDKTNVLEHVSAEHVQSHYCPGGGYDYRRWPNALDPTVFYDADGRMWMVYGSWNGGIFLLELDPATGRCIHPEADEEHNVDPYFGRLLLGGGHKSIEAPYILYNETAGYYYLFVSYGNLVRDGGYQIRCFRADSPEGPYVDMNGGTPMREDTHALFGLKLSGNYLLPSLPRGYKATGHNSAFRASDGRGYIVFHTRFDGDTEEHSPRVHQYLVSAEGWPCMLPYQTQGERVSPSGYPAEDIAGRWYVIDQGTFINSKLAEPTVWYLTKDGKLVGESVTGTWSAQDGTYYLTLSVDGGITFSGVLCAMEDEAGTPVMTFSCVGANRSVWGVKYLEK